MSYRYALVLLLLRLQASNFGGFLPSGSWRSIILAFPTVVAFALLAPVALVLKTLRGACERNALRLY
jgi:hypothetical protein